MGLPKEERMHANVILTSNSDEGLPLNANGQDESKSRSHRHARGTRTFLSPGVIGEICLNLVVAVCSAYFIVFAGLVYSRRNQSIDRAGNRALLEAANYNPTIFPIVFSAIVPKFLKSIAALKLEHGARVIALEYLLSSRSVFSAITAPLTLRSINLLTPILFVLWALSPLGGQAGLRVIHTQEAFTNTTQNFTYLAYVSPFTNEGVNSASAEPLIPINAIFTSALIGSAQTKSLAQDQFGNVKIPLYESLPPSPSGTDSDWRSVPDSSDVQFSSLAGLPLHNLPSSGVSRLTMNTGYMVAACNVSGEEWPDAYRQSLEQFRGWSGANYAISLIRGDPFAPMTFSLRSLDIYTDDATPSDKILTVANCTVTMEYMEVQIKCDGQTCQSVAARPSKTPATHDSLNVTSLNSTYYTPINGLGQSDIMYTYYLADFTNATNPTVGCDTSFCPPSAIEAYLADPANTLAQTSTTKLWKLGDGPISKRMSQLLNTYWVASIAPQAVAGNFVLANTTTYNRDSVIGTITTSETVLKCNNAWLAIMFICSLVLFISGMATIVLAAYRRGPDILDRFSSLLRDNPYVLVPHESSIVDAVNESRRLRDVMVRLGDVRPGDDVGYVAIATYGEDQAVDKLNPRRLYA